MNPLALSATGHAFAQAIARHVYWEPVGDGGTLTEHSGSVARALIHEALRSGGSDPGSVGIFAPVTVDVGSYSFRASYGPRGEKGTPIRITVKTGGAEPSVEVAHV
jgi:hypothetical protein